MTPRALLWFALICTGVSLVGRPALSGEYILDALEPEIEAGPIHLEIAPYMQLPPTSETQPYARINMLKPFGDGRGRLAVSDLRGPLYIVSDEAPRIYLDLSVELDAFYDEGGLGVGFASFAFHPEFAENGLFYTVHNEAWETAQADFASPVRATTKPGTQSVLLEWRARDPGSDVFDGSRREVMRIGFPGHGHVVQEIAFNPNLSATDEDYGNLYICVGEGSSLKHGHPELARSLKSVLGTVLRIDPLGRDSENGQYGIVPDNPWANDGDPGTLDEIFAFGFRNPHRLTWDSGGDGKAILTDIGDSNIEEVNLLQAGLNYGWNLREGTFRLEPDVARHIVIDLEPGEDEQSGFSFTYPVAQYDHSEGLAISGGQVYRGNTVPVLRGTYIFGDIVNGRIFGVSADGLELGKQSEIYEFSLKMDDRPVTLQELVGGGRVDLRIGSDLDGELYLMEKIHGHIYKVTGAMQVDVEDSSRDPVEQESTSAGQTNVVLIMADDLGWGDTGFNGNSQIRTPHLDRLAANGLILDRFYAASPVCSPTRASALTGRHPDRQGIPAANSGHLRSEEITLAEILQTNGYATGFFGKWHLGTLTTRVRDGNRGRPEDTTHYSIPAANGFDTFFATESKVPTYDPMHKPAEYDTARGEDAKYGWAAIEDKNRALPYGTRYWRDIETPATEDLNGDDSRIIMDRALAFIEAAVRNQDPFFAVIWLHSPHLPVVAGSEHRAMYSDRPRTEQLYYGAITALDEQVGNLWETLEARGVSDNTMLWFASDNGPERKTPGSAGPFRDRKRSLHEGGVRVPAFLLWPRHVEGGRNTAAPAVTSDYLPTILDFLDLDYPGHRPLDGISLTDIVRDAGKRRNRAIGFQYKNQQSWVSDRYKLISKDGGQTFELYDLLEDEAEQHDLAAQQPERVKAMKTALLDWMNSCTRSSKGSDYS